MGVFVLVVRAASGERASPELEAHLANWAGILSSLGGARATVLVVATHFNLLSAAVAGSVGERLDEAVEQLRNRHAKTLQFVGPSERRLWFAPHYDPARETAGETELRAAIVRAASAVARSMAVPAAYLEAQRRVETLWSALASAQRRLDGGECGGAQALASAAVLRQQFAHAGPRLRHEAAAGRALDYLCHVGAVLVDQRLSDVVVLQPLQWLGGVLAQLARDSDVTKNQLLALLDSTARGEAAAAVCAFVARMRPENASHLCGGAVRLQGLAPPNVTPGVVRWAALRNPSVLHQLRCRDERDLERLVRLLAELDLCALLPAEGASAAASLASMRARPRGACSCGGSVSFPFKKKKKRTCSICARDVCHKVQASRARRTLNWARARLAADVLASLPL